MDTLAKIKKDNEKFILPTYKRLPIAFKSGKAAVLTGVDGKKYLDFLSGIAVTNLGHNHPQITRVIQAQAKKLLHVSNLFFIPEQIKLAQKLLKLAGLNQAFFCNSGAEANEAAIKLVRHAAIELSADPNKVEIVCATNSFHGRTLGALSATMQPLYQQRVGPLVGGFIPVPFNDFEAMERSANDKTCAVLLEPVQAEGGMVFAQKDYLKRVEAFCRKRELFLILDEVQTGNGRTGRYFAFENYGIRPDVVTLAKGLGSGIPIGAILVNRAIAATVKPGIHASTFGGNPFATAVATKTVEILSQPATLKRVRALGKYLLRLADQLKRDFPQKVKETRGLGLFVGIEFAGEIDGAAFVQACLNRGVIINMMKNKVIRLAPPFVISRAQLEKGMRVIRDVVAGL